jgi:hypothetical protein
MITGSSSNAQQAEPKRKNSPSICQVFGNQGQMLIHAVKSRPARSSCGRDRLWHVLSLMGGLLCLRTLRAPAEFPGANNRFRLAPFANN